MPNEIRRYQNFLGGRLTHALPLAATVITDGVSNSTTTITSATAAFTAADVGATITGTDLPAAVYIASVTNGTTAILSAAATGTGSGRTWTINRHQTMHSAALDVMSVVNTTNHMIVAIDPDGINGEPEIVKVVKHDSVATWAQITRAQEGTAVRAHLVGMDWVHTLLASDTANQCFVIAASDETTVITTGTAKATFRMPFAMTLLSVRASLTTASTSGIPTIDINEGGVTILSTKLTVDVSEKTSTTAAVPAVISDTALADDAEITIDFDVAGTGTKGVKVYLIGVRA